MAEIVRRIFLAAITLAITSPTLRAVTVTPGNVLAAYGRTIFEVNTSGAIVQKIDVPFITNGETLGDLVYDPAGYIHVRTNAFTFPCCASLIASYNLATDQWTSTQVPIFQSGIADLELFQFGPTLYTESNKFDLPTRTSFNVRPTMHFDHQDASARNLTLGRDKNFYATWNFTPASLLYRIDPYTYEQVGFGLTSSNPLENGPNFYGIAVKENGDYYGVTFLGRILAFRNDGTFLRSSDLIGRAPGDLSLSSQGLLAFGQSAVGDSVGHLAIFNQELSLLANVTLVSLSGGTVYTTFVELPEPVGWSLLCVTGAMMSQRRGRRRIPRSNLAR
jgi:hypothetical protein